MIVADDLLVAAGPAIHFVREDEVPGLDDRFTIGEVSAAASRQSLLAGIAEALSFPDYFGGNWDAVEECLLELPSEDAVVLIVRDARLLWGSIPEECGRLVETWLSVVEERNRRDGGMHLVFVW
jgi:hypothetical protein